MFLIPLVQNWYCASKTEAEMKAFEYAKSSGLDLVTVCPTLVLGPLMYSVVNSSNLVLIKLLKGNISSSFTNLTCNTLYFYIYTCTRLCVCVCVCVLCIYVYVRICVCVVSIYIYIRMCVYICVRACVCVCVCVYICVSAIAV